MKHEPQFDKLESLGDWELENDSQDIRGRTLIDEDGKELGVIADLLVDKEAERVAAIRLKDGTALGIERVDIRDNRVLYLNAAGAQAHASATANQTHASATANQAHKSATQARTQSAGVAENAESVPIVEEDVAIGKRAVEGGTIKIRTRTVADNVSEDVTLRNEKVDVERVDVDREISAQEADRLFKDRTIEATERREEPVVAKTAKVTGQVNVSKEVDERVEHVEATERHTEVEVDRSQASNAKAKKAESQH